MMDSQVAISYINKLGGTHSQKLSNLALELWSWCIQRSITVHAEHVPGQLNVTADYESRHFNDSSDWKLDPSLFQILNQTFGLFTVDLFASYTNAQMEVFFSWKPDAKSAGIDALAQQWNCHLPYLFPPFALIGRCLQKIRKEKVQKAILIAPIWPAQTWYPLLLDTLMDHPRKLPVHCQLILNHWREPHPLLLQGHLTLAAWPISGDHCRTKAFLEKQSISSVHPGRASTSKSYNSCWNRWASWCESWKIDPVSSTIADIVLFLADLYKEGKQYSTINSHRSSISGSHCHIEGVPVGKHPIVIRFMQGIFNSRPPMPRYSFVWDIEVVLSHIRNIPSS